MKLIHLCKNLDRLKLQLSDNILRLFYETRIKEIEFKCLTWIKRSSENDYSKVVKIYEDDYQVSTTLNGTITSKRKGAIIALSGFYYILIRKNIIFKSPPSFYSFINLLNVSFLFFSSK